MEQFVSHAVDCAYTCGLEAAAAQMAATLRDSRLAREAAHGPRPQPVPATTPQPHTPQQPGTQPAPGRTTGGVT